MEFLEQQLPQFGIVSFEIATCSGDLCEARSMLSVVNLEVLLGDRRQDFREAVVQRDSILLQLFIHLSKMHICHILDVIPQQRGNHLAAHAPKYGLSHLQQRLIGNLVSNGNFERRGLLSLRSC